MCEPTLKVKNIMCKKIITAKENLSAQDAVHRHVGSIIVVDDEGQVIGMFTERDAIRLVANKSSLAEPLGKTMTRNVVTISLEATFDEAKRLMLTHSIRHLPVTDETGKLIGLFSMRAFFDEVLGVKSPTPSDT